MALGQTSTLTTDKTATWYYYITEISLRRLINRILNTFYVCSHRSWNPDTAHWMVEQAREFEEQLEAWSVYVFGLKTSSGTNAFL